MVVTKKLVALLGLIISAVVVFTILIILMIPWQHDANRAGKQENRLEERSVRYVR